MLWNVCYVIKPTKFSGYSEKAVTENPPFIEG